ncbi:hypothetical protein MIND_00505200 [Mycena indigotica]|nr:uncharacterized protein MIND_00505200 [Mycena indigotica]KAF7307118.1 hypothetical protein MIND_00505200 [Mycena indigotica]
MEWKAKEEENNVVEFVKGDTHGSKAVPPRFKEHTKLVCARHSRSGRKKYVKKHPERVRKVPSRKLDGKGCGASISYKTYFDSEEVRACYISEHSHEIGPANLAFTRRGRRLALHQDARKAKTPTPSGSNSMAMPPPPMLPPAPGVIYPPPMMVPWPGGSLPQDRWENLAQLFHSVREHARTFEFPMGSVAALESVLVRLLLESPVQPGALHVPPVPGQIPGPNPSQQQQHDPNIQPNLGESGPGSDSSDDA